MVTVFGWKKEYSVGIPEIDLQHRQLVAILQDLHGAMRKAEAGAVLGSILDRLQRYTAKHFATEERLFAEHRYPEATKHKREHDAFLARLQSFRQALDQGERLASTELLRFIEEWFADHLRTTDQRYVPFFEKIGPIVVSR
jgi:methyl-accepting chemotaxis protein/hemerythrin